MLDTLKRTVVYNVSFKGKRALRSRRARCRQERQQHERMSILLKFFAEIGWIDRTRQYEDFNARAYHHSIVYKSGELIARVYTVTSTHVYSTGQKYGLTFFRFLKLL